MLKRKQKVIAFDTETTGLDPYKAKAKIFAYSTFDGKNAIVKRFDDTDKVRNNLNKLSLQLFLDDVSIAKTCHNVKFEIGMLKMNGFNIPPTTVWHDTMIMSQLLDNISHVHSLDGLAYQYCGFPDTLDKEVKAYFKITGNYALIPKKLMHQYQINDAVRGLLLYDLFSPHIFENPKLAEIYQWEIELIKATQCLEEYGLMVDFKQCAEMEQWLGEELNTLQKDTKKILGEFINLNSDKQVKKLLFEDLKFPILEYSKETKQPKTDKNTIAALKEMGHDHPALDLILKCRSYTTGKTTVSKYMKLADENHILHPTIKTNHDKNGREAAENPNMQNVAKEEVQGNSFPVAARKCFRARPEHLLDFADYSGIELRLIADMTQDEELLWVFNHGDGDGHSIFAALWYGEKFTKADAKTKKILRGSSKNGTFALTYGAGLKRLATTLKITIQQAERGLKRIIAAHPKVANFSATKIDEVKDAGFITTQFGRPLKIPSELLYSATGNYSISGPAAEILKRAQVRVHKYYQEEFMGALHIVLPVHDEIVSERHRRTMKHDRKIFDDVSAIMTDFPEISVKLEVEWKRTFTTWNKAKEWEPA